MMLKQKKIRVLYVIPNLRKGGAERLLLTIVQELSKRDDFECLIVLLHEGNDYPELCEGLNIVLCSASVKLSVLGRNSAQIDELYAIMHDFRPHIIHTHLFEAEIVARWKLLKNTVYFSHIHYNEKQLANFSLSVLFNKRRFTDFYEKLFILKKYRSCCNYFLAISKHTEEYLHEVLPYDFRKRIMYLPNAVDFESFYFERNLSNPVENYRFVTIGRLVRDKNQAFLVDVINELHKNGIKATLDILGEGVLKSDIESKIRACGLQDYVFLRGNVADVHTYLRESVMYLHGATYEPFGLVLLEAMAAGLPVVSLNGGGNKELVQNGKNGYLLSKQEPKMFAEKIVRILGDKWLYQRMSEKACASAKEHDIKKYIGSLVVMYNDAFETYYLNKKKADY